MDVMYALKTMLVPTDYLTLLEALAGLLQRIYGKNWGQQEIGFESDSVTVPGAFTDDGKPMRGQPLDREVLAVARQQEHETRGRLLTALANGDLTASIEDGPSVRPSYWSQPPAETTLITGILVLGNFPDPEISRWQHNRVLLTQKQFDAWLKNVPGIGREARGRRQNAEQNAIMKLKIESVLAAAKRLWPEGKAPPGRNQAARLLAAERTVKETGYSEQTIRKILNGTYPASRRLGIPGYPGIDTQ
jgi:hypothetical protein